MLDYAINGGCIYDPESGKEDWRSIGIQSGKIVQISPSRLTAQACLEADGLSVIPGLIDIHMHEDVLDNGAGGLTIAQTMLRMGVTAALGGNCGFSPESIGEYFQYMDLNGYPINLALLCGYNLIRERLEGPGATTFRGADVYKQYSSAQIAEMEPAIRTAMKDGAFGLSFGFEYCPGCTAEEAVQAASYAKDEGCSLLAAHYRKDADGCVDSVREAVTISRESGIPFQFSHIGSGAAFGDDQIMRKCLRLLEGARQDGVDILADCYPYTAFSALIGTTVFDDGCLERWHASYEALLVADGPCRGERCTEALFRRLRREAPNTRIIGCVMTDAGVDAAIAHPLVMIGSDGKFSKGFGHPRGAGAFPRVLGSYVRERCVLNFYEAVDKMTIMPARRLHLKHKGRLCEGADADLVVLDRTKIRDRATFAEPLLPPDGISAVFVNGRLCVQNGTVLNLTAGRALRRQD